MTTSKGIVDAGLLERNAEKYAKLHTKAIDMLKKADGKTDYKEIAKILKIHEKTVSPILKESARLGLSIKKGKFYKKVSGILKYMPKSKNKKELFIALPDIVNRAKKKKIKLKIRHSMLSASVNFLDNAEKMAQAYLWLYITENTLRELIRKVVGGESGWWEKNVNDGIKRVVADAKAEYPYDGAKRKDELEYTHLGQLAEIITSNANWQKFQSFLKEKDKTAIQNFVRKAIPSRNSIGHCTPLTQDDLRFVELRFRDILKTIK